MSASFALGNGPALSGIAASADSAETASSNPAGTSRRVDKRIPLARSTRRRRSTTRSARLRLRSTGCGVGAGVSVERSNSHKVDVFLNVINCDEAPVDTGPSLIRGRVVGQNVDPYAIVLDMTYRF